MPAAPAEEVFLLPFPRHLETTGGSPQRPDAAVDEQLARDLPSQGYELTIAPQGVTIRFADPAGRRYAQATLAQLRSQYGQALPGLRIRDWPDFPVRGFMLDISRDRVPTRGTLERMVDLLSLLRINHLQLYTEHTYAYQNHSIVWENASPMTSDDFKWLDALCHKHGIELVPNQNTFGHMARWLAHPQYRQRAEAPDGWDTPWGTRLKAGVLAPTEENAGFCLDLLAELLPNFKSRRVNINCDETFELGQGYSRTAVAERGRGAVYAEYLSRLITGLHRQDREVLFWGDVVRQYPEEISALPRENSIGLAWHYEAPSRGPSALPPQARKVLASFGMDEAALKGFKTHVAPFVEHDFPFWVCPGTSSWNTLIGRLPNAFENLRDAVEVGLAQGAGGVLITDWGDNGHMAPPSISFLPLAYGGAIAWCLDSNRDRDVASALSHWVFEEEQGELGAVIAELGTLHGLTGVVTPNGSPLQFALIRENALSPFQAGEANRTGLSELQEKLQSLKGRVERSQPGCQDGEIVKRELCQAMDMARHGAWRLARAAGFECPDAHFLSDDLERCIAGQKACWLERSRPGGLEDSVARLLPALAEYRD